MLTKVLGQGRFTGCVAARSVTHSNPCLEYSSQRIINPLTQSVKAIMHGWLQTFVGEGLSIDLFAFMMSAFGPASAIKGCVIR